MRARRARGATHRLRPRRDGATVDERERGTAREAAKPRLSVESMVAVRCDEGGDEDANEVI